MHLWPNQELNKHFSRRIWCQVTRAPQRIDKHECVDIIRALQPQRAVRRPRAARMTHSWQKHGILPIWTLGEPHSTSRHRRVSTNSSFMVGFATVQSNGSGSYHSVASITHGPSSWRHFSFARKRLALCGCSSRSLEVRVQLQPLPALLLLDWVRAPRIAKENRGDTRVSREEPRAERRVARCALDVRRKAEDTEDRDRLEGTERLYTRAGVSFRSSEMDVPCWNWLFDWRRDVH